MRDWHKSMRAKGQWLQPLVFFTMCVSLFPLAISPDPTLLKDLSVGVIWVCALLSVLLNLPQIFAQDHTDGSLEQIVLSSYPLSVAVLAKSTAHWLLACLPLVALSPLLAASLFMPAQVMPVLILSLLFGTPAMSMIGAMASALTVGLKQSGILITLLVLPLYVPVLLLGTGAVVAAMQGLSSIGQLGLLLAYSVLCISLMPLAVAAALKISITS